MTSGYPDWTRAIQLLGRDAVTGEPVVLGLDGDGRITVFLVDDTDQWGQVLAVGNAELAGRLGFPATWDQRGKIVWWTDFRDGLAGLYTDTDGIGASVTIDPTYSLSGGYSVKLLTTAGAARFADVGISIDSPPAERFGAYVRWLGDQEFDFLELHMEIGGDTGRCHAGIRFGRANDELDYLDSDEEWQTWGELALEFGDITWHNLKLVIDRSADTYLRALVGGTEYDLSGYDMYNDAEETEHQMVCYVRLSCLNGDSESVWIDTMAVTVGEPT